MISFPPRARIDKGRLGQRYVYMQSRDNEGYETFKIMRSKIPNDAKARKIVRNINRILRHHRHGPKLG